MKKTALIMASGRGERFWPRIRKNLPKQFLSLTDDGKTMIQLTVERFLPIAELEDIYIATNKDYKALVLEQIQGLPEENVLCEPVGRNTAPCIGLGALHISAKYGDAVMMVLPSDHLIKCSGMFVWKVSTILNNLKKYMPETYQRLQLIKNSIRTSDEDFILDKEFPSFLSESIDYGIMEKAENIFPGTFGWGDVGSWLAVERIKKSNEFGNVVNGNIITIDSKNCIIKGSKKLIATVGIENLIIVDTEDATLICDKDSAGDIKKILENLKICNRNEYI